MSPEKKKCVMIRYRSKTDPQMIYQQNLSTRMFVSHKLHKNARINFLQKAKFLGQVDAKKPLVFCCTVVKVNKII